MFWRIEVSKRGRYPQTEILSRELRESGLESLLPLKAAKLFFLAGISEKEAKRAAEEIFTDPVSETYTLTENQVGVAHLEILFNPGVMDPSLESIRRALADCGLSPAQVRTGRAYFFIRKPNRGELFLLQRFFYNPLIEHTATEGEQLFSEPCTFTARRTEVPIREKTVAELEAISRQRLLALNTEEMLTLKDYYQQIGRDPTDVELETYAQTWSEHCQHKTFRGDIDFHGRKIKNLLKSTIFRVTEELNPDWCLSVFQDNSGVIAFDDEYALTFKVETHNHPSALEPYGGAATGIGGVIRDCLGTGLGAKPILCTDVFCFAPLTTPAHRIPEGVIPPKQIVRGVVSGVRDYGNRMGIPTANGAVYFHEGFLGNPLVFCGTVGLLPRKAVKKRVRKGQLILLLGGRTGRDGIHGVTFASLELEAEKTTEQRNLDAVIRNQAVQIGNPIEEKKLLDVVLAARDLGLIEAITDCGGGGLSSAIGELASSTGCEVWLDRVPLKYAGLTPAEIWISEAQERMIIFTSEAKAPQLCELAAKNDVEATVIGRTTGTGRMKLYFQNEEVADLEMEFLHHGWRCYLRKARWQQPDCSEPFIRPDQDLTQTLLKLLQAPNIASKEWIIRQYDHEVQGQSILKPFCGPDRSAPTDACVITPLAGSKRGCVVACGLAPRYGLIDPYWMAASAIDEALRNCLAVGGDLERTALLDNFCWGSPEQPEQLGGLVRAAQACYDIARGYRVPFISGKDSLYNEFKYASGESASIPPTLLISALSVIEDVNQTVTADLKESGSYLYVLGETKDELGGSEYFRLHQGLGREVPRAEPRQGRRLMKALSRAIRHGLVRACHDVAEGGLGVCLAEMGFSGIGARVNLRAVPRDNRVSRDDILLFSESNTRFICEVKPESRRSFEALLQGLPYGRIGQTIAEPLLLIQGLKGEKIVSLDLLAAQAAWRKSLSRHL